MAKGFTIEFPETARLLFNNHGVRLVINPRPAKCQFTFQAGNNYTCPKCGKSGLDSDHYPEGYYGTEVMPIPNDRVIDEYASEDGHWFAFWEEDCAFPPIYIVRAESWEQAYEDFCEQVLSPLSESDLADYEKDSEDYYTDLTWTDRGWISTENVNGCEITLIEVTCE